MEGIAANPIIHTIEGMKQTQASRSLKMKQTPASRSWKKSAATPASKSWGEGSYSNISQHPCIMEEMQLPEHPDHGRIAATPASRSWKENTTPMERASATSVLIKKGV
jgi:hypothetical protein